MATHKDGSSLAGSKSIWSWHLLDKSARFRAQLPLDGHLSAGRVLKVKMEDNRKQAIEISTYQLDNVQ